MYNYVCKSIDGNPTCALRSRCTDSLLFSGGVFISFARSHSELDDICFAKYAKYEKYLEANSISIVLDQEIFTAIRLIRDDFVTFAISRRNKLINVKTKIIFLRLPNDS